MGIPSLRLDAEYPINGLNLSQEPWKSLGVIKNIKTPFPTRPTSQLSNLYYIYICMLILNITWIWWGICLWEIHTLCPMLESCDFRDKWLPWDRWWSTARLWGSPFFHGIDGASVDDLPIWTWYFSCSIAMLDSQNSGYQWGGYHRIRRIIHGDLSEWCNGDHGTTRMIYSNSCKHGYGVTS